MTYYKQNSVFRVALYYNYFNLRRHERTLLLTIYTKSAARNRGVNQILITLTPRCIQLISAPCSVGEKFRTREIIKVPLSRPQYHLQPFFDAASRECTSSSFES